MDSYSLSLLGIGLFAILVGLAAPYIVSHRYPFDKEGIQDED